MIPTKFKLWDKINHKWVDEDKYDIYINSEGKGCVGYMVEYEDECRYKNLEYVVVKNIDYTPNLLKDQFEVVLWTGLKDSNGKDIYYGDIIEYTQHYFNTDKTTRKRKVVKYNELTGCWNIFETKAGESNIVVIGNIYENPELINN